MKLLRYGKMGSEKPGCLDQQGNIRDLSAVIADVNGDILSSEQIIKLAALNLEALPIVTGQPRLGACVGNVGKFVCIGLNYADHAKETGVTPPSEPVLFCKASSAICGPHDELILPFDSEHTDWEVELGVVIGRVSKRVKEQTALDHVAGYCVINDVSERHYQLHRMGQWTKGKSCDTFGPLGPWLVTKDEVVNPQHLSMWLEVDGKRYQNGHTGNMIFSVAHLVSYVSQFMTLYPGDVISTGTPAGVGMGQKPNPIYLQPGQVVKLGIAGLGEQEHLAVRERV